VKYYYLTVARRYSILYEVAIPSVFTPDAPLDIEVYKTPIGRLPGTYTFKLVSKYPHLRFNSSTMPLLVPGM